MPGGDGTGPTGKGPMTGRGLGRCGGGRRGASKDGGAAAGGKESAWNAVAAAAEVVGAIGRLRRRGRGLGSRGKRV